MRRFLVVGCGGSGGKTLAYMMDQLRSDLGRHNVHRIPRGWQFVHIDVPTVSERGPDGLGSVQDQGGTYIGCSPGAATYPVVDDTVSRSLARNGQALHGIASWAPRDPHRVVQPIGAGAGQFRALGRMISLSQARTIREQFQHVWDRLGTPEATGDMSRLDIPGLGAFQPSTPVVLVVSSMAGGAGASMALDVCRLLSEVRGLEPALMGVFMVAPNVFDRLDSSARVGVRPNALAMLGEIVASQVGSARDHDLEVLSALGVELSAQAAHPFARVFPVGRFAGVDRMQFGDGSPETVYRGLARGLAALMTSGTASESFVAYDLGNRGSKAGNQSLLGWGADWPNIPWGSYGFASLSMGRDRYAEYAAQRIARTGVDRLLRGHLQVDSRASATEQVNALVTHQWAGTCERAGIPAQATGVESWFRSSVRAAFPDAAVAMESTKIVNAEVRPYLPEGNGVHINTWAPALRHAVASRAPYLAGPAHSTAQSQAYTWHRRLFTDIVGEIERSVAAHGLAYAGALTDTLSLHLRDTVAAGVDAIAAAPLPRLDALPQEAESQLAKLRGVVNAGPQVIEQVCQGGAKALHRHVHKYAADFAAYLLRQFTYDVLVPMRDALAEAQRILEKAEATPAVDVGLARLATDQVLAWPSDADERVPSRFSEANNEVLLTSTAGFADQYQLDLRRAIGGQQALTLTDARERVTAEVVSGRWATTGGNRAPGGLVEITSEWRAGAFQNDPSGQPISPARARFDVHIRPTELLDRARRFVARPHESFDKYVSVSIEQFIGEASESERDVREREVVLRFTEALALARPLIGVDQNALNVVHPNESIEYFYKFSAVPLLRRESLVEKLKAALAGNPMIKQPTRDTFAEAVTDIDADRIAHIDIFGAYPNYSPLVFDAVVQPVTEQWTALSGDEARRDFWTWRRARPLAAALPMTEIERRAMVAGWMIGRLTGRIRRLPVQPYDEPVQIWDGAKGTWEDFPHPLLTPPTTFRASYDWLPAVLESVLLAIARSHRAPAMGSLRPYELLRGLYNASPTADAGPMVERSADGIVRAWLRGTLTGGSRSSIPGAAEAESPEERAAVALKWLDENRVLAGTHYMKRQGEAPGGGSYSVIPHREHASATPIFRDIAPDVFWATGELRRIVEEQLALVHEPDRDLPPDVPPPAAAGYDVPEGLV